MYDSNGVRKGEDRGIRERSFYQFMAILHQISNEFHPEYREKII
uniref:Uncharacterized protein n=1 Tax=Arundo donax TaxID=35708 RepID=A0A0A9DUA2_ARUDO